jgi:hypothetical protein
MSRTEVVDELSENIIEEYGGELLDWIYACLTQYPGQVTSFIFLL